jgi:hypothetical protein
MLDNFTLTIVSQGDNYEELHFMQDWATASFSFPVPTWLDIDVPGRWTEHKNPQTLLHVISFVGMGHTASHWPKSRTFYEPKQQIWDTLVPETLNFLRKCWVCAFQTALHFNVWALDCLTIVSVGTS